MTYDPSVTVNGTAVDVLSASGHLSMVGGCRGARFSVSGSVREAFAFDRGDTVVMRYTGSTAYYLGKISEPGRTVETNIHEYEVESLWTRLDQIVVAKRTVFGSTVSADAETADERRVTGQNTAADIVEWILTNWIYPAGDGVSASTALIVDNSVAVTEFVVDKGSDLTRAMETLRLIASSSSTYVVGINASGVLYFRALALTDTLQLTVTIGSDIMRAKESPSPAAFGNALHVIGSRLTTGDSKGHISNRVFSSAASIAARGRKKRRLMLKTLRLEADMTSAANGYFNWYASPDVTIRDLENKHDTDNSPPIPWLGPAKYLDPVRSDLAVTEYLAHVEFILGSYFSYRVTIGREDTGDSMGPDDFADDNVANSDPGGNDDDDGVSDVPIEVTDLLPPPDDYPRPFFPDTDSGGGAGGGSDSGLEGDLPSVGLIGGTPMQIMTTGGKASATEVVHTIVVINNGGEAAPVGSLVLYRKWWNGSAVSSLSSETMVRLNSQNNIEVWGTQTGIVTPTEGWLLQSVQSLKTKSSPAAYYYWPCNPSSTDWTEWHVSRILDTTGGAGGAGGIYLIQMGYYQ